eukprot:gene2050-2372_t
MAATMKQTRVSACRCSRASLRRAVRVSAQKQAVAVTVAPVVVKEHGAYTVKGTVRKVNEDRFDVQVVPSSSAGKGDPFAFAGVYDGHGGSAVAEWLSENLSNVVGKYWKGGNAAEACVNEAYIQADKQLLVSKGFLGLGDESYLVLASDGLFAEEVRGGGGGLDNEGVAELCKAAGPNTPCDNLAQMLAKTAVKVGSTDDVTVVVMRLGRA